MAQPLLWSMLLLRWLDGTAAAAPAGAECRPEGPAFCSGASFSEQIHASGRGRSPTVRPDGPGAAPAIPRPEGGVARPDRAGEDSPAPEKAGIGG